MKLITIPTKDITFVSFFIIILLSSANESIACRSSFERSEEINLESVVLNILFFPSLGKNSRSEYPLGSFHDNLFG